MSNPNTPFGFQHIGWARGGPGVTGGQVERKIAAAYSYAIAQGDMVINQTSTPGYIQRGTTGVAGGNVAGIFCGCSYLSTSAGRRIFSTYWPTGDHAYDGTAYIIPIAGVPPQLFKVQALSTVITIADFGKTIEISAGAASTTGGWGKSTMSVDRGSMGTASYPFKIVDTYASIAPAGAPGTDDTASYNIVIVESNPWAEVTLA